MRRLYWTQHGRPECRPYRFRLVVVPINEGRNRSLPHFEGLDDVIVYLHRRTSLCGQCAQPLHVGAYDGQRGCWRAFLYDVIDVDESLRTVQSGLPRRGIVVEGARLQEYIPVAPAIKPIEDIVHNDMAQSVVLQNSTA